MASFEDIHVLIVNKIKTLNMVTAVFPYEKADAQSFPYATVAYQGNSNEIADTANNLVGYKYRVRVYMKIGGDMPLSGTDAEKSSMRAYQQVLDAFSTDITLGGACRGGIDVVEGDGGYTDSANARVRVSEFVLTCKKLEQVIN